MLIANPIFALFETASYRGADLVWSPTRGGSLSLAHPGLRSSHASGVQEASPEGWQEISPGWSASDTRGFLFNANRTPGGCEDNLDSSASREGERRPGEGS